MTPSEAKEKYGAEFYTTMKDGETPQMYYKYETTNWNDGTSTQALCYLSFANLWMGSGLPREYTPEELSKKLIKIN